MSERRVSKAEIEAINRELAGLLHTDPLELPLAGEASLADRLILCGVLGGKDVGKSTLINQLARAPVSVDEAEAGEGTLRPMAYVHRDMRHAVAARLAAMHERVPLDVTEHESDAIRNLVLVDLPDFDSEFTEHVRIVSAVAPLLDRVLWVLTPRKLGDRAWVDILPRVIKNRANVHCVLNKVDELLTDADPFEGRDGDAAEAFWRTHADWLAQCAAQVGCDHVERQRFLIAARYPDAEAFTERIAHLWDDADWSRYGGDRDAVRQVGRRAAAELDRLRDAVLTALTPEQAQAIKQANLERELQVAADRLRDHYRLDRTCEALSRVCDADYLDRTGRYAFEETFAGRVVEALGRRIRRETELADLLLERRVHRWPLLRLIYWPFGWLSRSLGRQAGPRAEDRTWGDPDFDRHLGEALEERVEALRARMLRDHAVLAQRLGIEADLPAPPRVARETAAALRALPGSVEAQVVAKASEADRPPGLFARFGLWFVFLWFPLIQPIADAVLGMWAIEGAWDAVRCAHKIVTALSAYRLLAGLAMVGVVFVLILAAMYTRALRSVRRVRAQGDDASEMFEAVEAALSAHAIAPLTAPFRERLQRLLVLRDRLSAR